MADKHYVGEIGTAIIVDCGCDITGSTEFALKVKKPSGTTTSWTPEIYNSNYLKYTTVSGDLDVAGQYLLQSSLNTGTWKGLGETAYFRISEIFE